MFSSLATKVALKKIGLPSNTFDFDFSSGSAPPPSPRRVPNKLRKNPPSPRPETDDEDGNGWTSWMSVKALPLTVQPWLAPPPPPIRVGPVPGVGDPAPADHGRKLVLGGGRRVLLVFLRCAGCAFAQRTFLNLRTIANRYSGSLHCIAVSHASEQATKKWLDLLGGPWSVQIIVDEDRSIYAAWGLGLGNMWYVLNPATQMQGWKEKGWLGDKVAGAIEKSGVETTVMEGGPDDDDGATTVMGNKWQEAGAFAIDGRGTVIWGNKALRADDVMDLNEGATLLSL